MLGVLVFPGWITRLQKNKNISNYIIVAVDSVLSRRACCGIAGCGSTYGEYTRTSGVMSYPLLGDDSRT